MIKMSIRERLESVKGISGLQAPAGKTATAEQYESYHALKSRVHQKLLERVDLKVMETLAPEKLRDELKILVDAFCQKRRRY
jgi:pilus assembly protein CpaF